MTDTFRNSKLNAIVIEGLKLNIVLVFLYLGLFTTMIFDGLTLPKHVGSIQLMIHFIFRRTDIFSEQYQIRNVY